MLLLLMLSGSSWACQSEMSRNWSWRGVMHAPLEHASSGVHAFAQLPQWAPSLVRSVQTPLQSVSDAWQESAQDPPEQTSPGAHTVAQSPQWPMSVWRLVHVPLQSVSEDWQVSAQAPFEQTSPGAHAVA